jgi:hypothetical protein
MKNESLNPWVIIALKILTKNNLAAAEEKRGRRKKTK